MSMRVFLRNRRALGAAALLLALSLTACGSSAAPPAGTPAASTPPPPVRQTDGGQSAAPGEGTETPRPAGTEDGNLESGAHALEELRRILDEEDMVAAIAFVGYAEDADLEQIADTFREEQPILTLIPQERYIEFEGDELYLVVPRDEEASVAVNQWICDESNGFWGETGQVFYRSDSGEPVLLRGNESDAVPNLQVVIVEENGEVDYTPRLYLQDKSLQWGEGVADITHYPNQAQEGLDTGSHQAVMAGLRENGWLCPTEFTLAETPWHVWTGADEAWCMEFTEDEHDRPYDGYCRIYRTDTDGGEADLSGWWAIEDERLSLILIDGNGQELRTESSGYPILINLAGEEIRMFPGKDGTLPLPGEGELVLSCGQG